MAQVTIFLAAVAVTATTTSGAPIYRDRGFRSASNQPPHDLESYIARFFELFPLPPTKTEVASLMHVGVPIALLPTAAGGDEGGGLVGPGGEMALVLEGADGLVSEDGMECPSAEAEANQQEGRIEPHFVATRTYDSDDDDDHGHGHDRSFSVHCVLVLYPDHADTPPRVLTGSAHSIAGHSINQGGVELIRLLHQQLGKLEEHLRGDGGEQRQHEQQHQEEEEDAPPQPRMMGAEPTDLHRSAKDEDAVAGATLRPAQDRKDAQGSSKSDNAIPAKPGKASEPGEADLQPEEEFKKEENGEADAKESKNEEEGEAEAEDSAVSTTAGWAVGLCVALAVVLVLMFVAHKRKLACFRDGWRWSALVGANTGNNNTGTVTGGGGGGAFAMSPKQAPGLYMEEDGRHADEDEDGGQEAETAPLSPQTDHHHPADTNGQQHQQNVPAHILQ